MRLSISRLRFNLSGEPIAQYVTRIDTATSEIKELQRASGKGSEKFKRAFAWVMDALRQDRNLSSVLLSPLELRALAILFNTELASRIELSSSVLRQIEKVRPKPGSLLVEAIFSHYLTKYDQLTDTTAVEAWLLKVKGLRGDLNEKTKHLLGGNGPKWLAEESHREGRDFDEQVNCSGLGRYRSGRFLTIAKNIYYLDVLRELQPNHAHSILDEMQKKAVYDSRYDENSLLGHQILSILIEKAPVSGVCDAWLNVILAIGGDPRVPPSHPNYRKWWSQLDAQLKNKVQGWLSKLDLRLFLEALADFSYQPDNEDLKRMYPARKHFMEGLLNKQLVNRTRLFLSYSAEKYLKRNYKPEHLPSYSLVDGDRSLIHIQLSNAHMVEGSHNCKLWIYEKLDQSAVVFDYSKKHVTYRSLTGGLRDQMMRLGIMYKAEITHSPYNFNWQNKAIVALKDIGVPIDSKDVLTPEDHKKYKRLYGA